VLLVDLAGGLAFRLDLGTVPTWSTLTPTAASPLAAGDPFDGPASEPVVRVGGSSGGAASEPVVQVGGSFGSVDPFAGVELEPVVPGMDPIQGPAPGPLVGAPVPTQGLASDRSLVGAATTATATGDMLGATTLVNM